MKEIQRILFIRTDRMGDVLMNLPALRLLRQSYPKAWIAMLVDASVAELLKGHPDFDEVMTVSAGESFGKLLGRVRQARFDMEIGRAHV